MDKPTFMQLETINMNNLENTYSPESIYNYYSSADIPIDNEFMKRYIGSDLLTSTHKQDQTTEATPMKSIKDLIGEIDTSILSQVKTPSQTTETQVTTPETQVTTPVSTKPIDANNKVSFGIKFFMDKGLSKEQASGIMGNLHAESNLNTNSIGDNGTSYGIAQWHNERWKALRNFAKNKGSKENDYATQLEFLWHELNTSEKGALDSLKRSTTPEDAARNFAYKFERMKIYNKQREQNARKFHKS